MGRWRKGTNDQDGDGRKGGSRKEDDMAKVAPKKKLTIKKPEAEPAEPVAGVDGAADANAAAAHNAAFEAASEEERAAMLADLQVSRQVRGW